MNSRFSVSFGMQLNHGSIVRLGNVQVQLNVNALPLVLLLVHPGGSAQARGFVARALELWQKERARARMTHALARWAI